MLDMGSGIAFNLDVAHADGVVRTDGFSLLVYAPAQWGEGVRTEDNGTPVAAIVAASADDPDRESLARRFGTTVAHVKQALAYGLMTE